jgi:hypothetical protein
MVFASLTIANSAKAGLGWTAWKPLITSAGNLAGYERLAELAPAKARIVTGFNLKRIRRCREVIIAPYAVADATVLLFSGGSV